MIAVFVLTCFVAVSGSEHCGDAWPLWRTYVAHFVSADRRVINRINGDHSYYDQNLVLFGQGIIQGRYHFAVDGALYPSWETQCINQ
jgi:endo-1,4-beta-D-glucanase Y